MRHATIFARGLILAATGLRGPRSTAAALVTAMVLTVALAMLLPAGLEQPGTLRVVKAMLPTVKVLRLLAGCRQDWRSVLLDLLA